MDGPNMMNVKDTYVDDDKWAWKHPEIGDRILERGRSFDDANDDVLEIPDISEGAAAKIARPKLPTLRELDAKLDAAGGGDERREHLSVLEKRLLPASKTVEMDETWDFDSMMHELRQQFHAMKGN